MKPKILSKVGRYEFLSEPFHCDFSNRLFMGHLGNHLLNAADFHSNDRGYGMNYLMPRHRTWVLSRLAIEMTEMPESYDKFFVETWVEGAMKYFTSRNFKICGANSDADALKTSDADASKASDAEEKVYGYGKSVWAMIDTETRQPVDIFSIHDGLINEYIETEKPCPIAASGRVKIGKEAKLVRSIDTYYSDVDINGHINSVKYIEHVLDLFDLDYYKTHFLRRFEIAYVAESHQGDRLNFYLERVGTDGKAFDDGKAEQIATVNEPQKVEEFCIKITKNSKNGADEVEVVRSKVKFIKK